MIGDGAAQVYVPIVFTIGAPGQQPQPTRFLIESGSNQDGKRMESVEYSAYPRANPLVANDRPGAPYRTRATTLSQHEHVQGSALE